MYHRRPEPVHKNLPFAVLLDFMMERGFGKNKGGKWTTVGLANAIAKQYGNEDGTHPISRPTIDNYRNGKSRPQSKWRDKVEMIAETLLFNEEHGALWRVEFIKSWERSITYDKNQYRGEVTKGKRDLNAHYRASLVDSVTGSPSSSQPIVTLRPNSNIREILSAFPAEFEQSWMETSIDGAIEISRFPDGPDPYGGIVKEEISCECHDDMWWPYDSAITDPGILDALALAMKGPEDGNFRGWLEAKGTGEARRASPNPIRVLLRPPADSLSDRTNLHIVWGNSDYFTMRSITELTRLGRKGLTPRVQDVFHSFWGSSYGSNFPTNCVPYHVSVQAVICLEPKDGNKYILLAAINSQHSSITSGWSATMAEQCQSPNRPPANTAWWEHYINREAPFKKADTRHGDLDINEAIERGLREEFRIERSDLNKDYRLLNAAIEEDMFFVTYIYFVSVSLTPEEAYKRWKEAPDAKENRLLAAYQIEGLDENGKSLNGPERLAQLIAQDRFNGRPYVLPKSNGSRPLEFDWHPSSRLRLYAAGRHMYQQKFRELVEVSG